jgi:hypothetical protein
MFSSRMLLRKELEKKIKNNVQAYIGFKCYTRFPLQDAKLNNVVSKATFASIKNINDI